MLLIEKRWSRFSFVVSCLTCLVESRRKHVDFAGLGSSDIGSHVLVSVLFAATPALHKCGSKARSRCHFQRFSSGLQQAPSNEEDAKEHSKATLSEPAVATERLKKEFHIFGAGLVSFMSSSVAARLDDERFWHGLQRLQNEFDISGSGLVTFMSGSVATRLDDERFWYGLQRLQNEFGMSASELVRFMSNSLAARLDDERLWHGLQRLQKEFGMSGSELVRFMSDSVAARLDDERFWHGLQRLQKEFGMPRSELVTFMSGSVAARLDDERFWHGCQRLQKDFSLSGSDLASLMSDTVAVRLGNKKFMDALAYLGKNLGHEATLSLVCGSGLPRHLNQAVAKSIIRTTWHLDAFNFTGTSELKRVIGKTALSGKIPELEAAICSLKTHKELITFLAQFRGSYRHKSKMARDLFGS